MNKRVEPILHWQSKPATKFSQMAFWQTKLPYRPHTSWNENWKRKTLWKRRRGARAKSLRLRTSISLVLWVLGRGMVEVSRRMKTHTSSRTISVTSKRPHIRILATRKMKRKREKARKKHIPCRILRNCKICLAASRKSNSNKQNLLNQNLKLKRLK